MVKHIKVLRILEYIGTPEFIQSTLKRRGVKGSLVMPSEGTIKEAFMGDVFDYIVPDVVIETPEKRTHIKLNPAEIQGGYHRLDWAEGLILQLPRTHEGRNSWLLNYGIGDEAKALRNKRSGLVWNADTISLDPVNSNKDDPQS